MKQKLLILLMVVLGIAEGARAANVEINATNFPDEKFRNWILARSYGADGILTDEEIAGVTEIDVNMVGISDLTGIEYFTALKTLFCGSNRLTALDVSKNTALTYLACHNNQLTTLDVSKNTALEKLYCYGNQLTTLDISNNTLLSTMSCYNNQLTALDLSKNTEMGLLECNNNQLTALDVSKNTVLSFLQCNNNQLTALDLSKNTALQSLYCDDNQLTALDVSKNTALKSLDCSGNGIRGTEMATLINSLYDRSSLYQGTLYVYKNETSVGNVMTAEQVATATGKNWKVRMYDGSTWVDYPGGVPIIATNFPDEKFRAALSSTDIGADGFLTETEIAGVAKINASNKDISDLKGIEFFTALETLQCENNQLTALDVSKNTALKILSCTKNKLTALDVSKNTALKSLDCSNNNLKNLDVSKNTALEKLYCVSDGLTALDVSKNTALETLNCFDNQLTTLDVSKNTALTYLNCSNNQLTTLDASKNTALKELYCHENQLTALDVSKNTVLEILSCTENQLTALDVSKNTALKNLYCDRNQLTTLDASNKTALKNLYCWNNQLTTLDLSTNTELYALICHHNQLTSLDVSKNANLRYLDCYGNCIRGAGLATLVSSLCDRSSKAQGSIDFYYDETPIGNEMTTLQVAAAAAKNWKTLMKNGDNWVEYPGVDPGVAINATNFPDAKFRAYVSSSCDADKDGFLSDSEIAEVKEISLSDAEIEDVADLKGVELFTALESLDCWGNKLTAIDVSKNTALTFLDCGYNQLTALNVSKNTALKFLYCYGNQLTTLDLSKNTALVRFDCSYNKLTALDVSKNTKLCEVYCFNNNIRDEGMATLVNGLYNRSATTQGKLYVCKNETDTGNEMSISQVASATGKNWKVLMASGSDWVDYPGVAPGPAIDATNFPDAVFRTYVSTNCDTDKDGYLSKEEIASVKEITISNKGVTNMKGVELFTALYYLSCYYNKLTTLDVSKNTALEYLYCYNNQLTKLDVSKNTALKNLKCYKNQLTTLDLSKNKKLTQLHCYSNAIRDDGMQTLVSSLYKRTSTSAGKLYVYSKETATGNMMTAEQVASAKGKNWQVLLASGEDWVDYPGGMATVTLNKPEVIVKKKNTVTLTATLYPETLTDKSVKWESSDESVATVTSDGVVKGIKSGVVTITCTSNATAASATCQVTVSTITLNPSEAVVKKKSTITLTPTVYPSTLEDKSVKWKSSDKTIATVSSSGKVTGVKSGVVTITCTSVATGVSATCKVTVGTITLNKSSVTVDQGKTVTLTPTVYPSTLEDKTVKWKSSDKSVATVTSAGKVKGVKPGVATITCTSNATGLSTTCTVTVPGVVLDQTEVILRKKNTLTLTPTFYPETLEDKSVTWKSSDKTIATVSSAGKVTGVKSGVVTITCTSKATGLSATCKVTVATITLDQSEVIVRKKNTVTLTPTVYPTSLEDKSVTWKSSDESVATVSSDGVVTGVKSGFVTITCTSNATGLSATCKVTVGTITLSKSSATLVVGKTLTLTPTVYPTTLEDQSVTWKSSNTKVATVKNGKVKAVKAGTATITCTSNATGLSTTCKITVKKSASARTIDGEDAELTDIEIVEEAPAAEEPFDVYDLRGRRVLQRVTSLDGLPAGVYIVKGKKVLKK